MCENVHGNSTSRLFDTQKRLEEIDAIIRSLCHVTTRIDPSVKYELRDLVPIIFGLSRKCHYHHLINTDCSPRSDDSVVELLRDIVKQMEEIVIDIDHLKSVHRRNEQVVFPDCVTNWINAKLNVFKYLVEMTLKRKRDCDSTSHAGTTATTTTTHHYMDAQMDVQMDAQMDISEINILSVIDDKLKRVQIDVRKILALDSEIFQDKSKGLEGDIVYVRDKYVSYMIATNSSDMWCDRSVESLFDGVDSKLDRVIIDMGYNSEFDPDTIKYMIGVLLELKKRVTEAAIKTLKNSKR